MKPFRPYKPRRPGTTKAVVSRLFDGAGGIEFVASLIGLSTTRTRARAEESEPDQLSYDHVRRLTMATGTPVAAEDLAFLAGGVFVPLNPSPEALPAILSREETEHGQFMAIVCALLTGKADVSTLSEAERAKVIAESEASIHALVAVRCKLASLAAESLS